MGLSTSNILNPISRVSLQEGLLRGCFTFGFQTTAQEDADPFLHSGLLNGAFLGQHHTSGYRMHSVGKSLHL